MAKPSSSTGYHMRWQQLADTAFKEEGLDAKSMMIRDMEAHQRALLSTLRAFMIECFVDDQEEKNPIRFAGVDRARVLHLIAADTGSLSLREAATMEPKELSLVVFPQLTHWKLPDLGYRRALGELSDLPNRVELLEPFRPDDVQPPEAWRE